MWNKVVHILLYILILESQNVSGTLPDLTPYSANEPSFLQKIASYIFPFGTSFFTTNEDAISEPSNRIVKYQRPPPSSPKPFTLAPTFLHNPRPQPESQRDLTQKDQLACSPCNKIPWIPILVPNVNNKPIKLQATRRPPPDLPVDTIYGKVTTFPPIQSSSAHTPWRGEQVSTFVPFPVYGPPPLSTTSEPPFQLVPSISLTLPTFTSTSSNYQHLFSSTTRAPLRKPHNPKIHKYLSEISTVQNITFTTRRPPRPPGKITSLEYLPPRQVLPIENDNNLPNLGPRLVPPLRDAEPFQRNPYAYPGQTYKFVPVETQYTAQEPLTESTRQVEVITSVPQFTILPKDTLEKLANSLLAPSNPVSNELLQYPSTTPAETHHWHDLETSTTPKPWRENKRAQFIIPYIIRQRPRPFKAKQMNFAEETTTTTEAGDSQETQESNVVTQKAANPVVTPASIQKSTKYVAKILASSIRELLQRERVNVTQNLEPVPLDVSQELQQRIDRWTEEQFGSAQEQRSAPYPATKSIPQEYLTPSPLFPKITVATVPPTTPTPTTRRTAHLENRHRLTDTESLDYMLINRLKTNFKIAKAYAERENHHNNRLWKALQVSISPITKERLYIVTPQALTAPRDEASVDAGSTEAAPRFSIRPRPGSKKPDLAKINS